MCVLDKILLAGKKLNLFAKPNFLSIKIMFMFCLIWRLSFERTCIYYVKEIPTTGEA